MKKAKILFVFQEITPYLDDSPMANIGRHLPQGVQERGREIRTFLPRYGCINERRNQLHEVIRLSGMNIIIDDTDHPLIIKVASIQSARMQIYFIDNEDYFHRKSMMFDEETKPFKDNDERAVFFCRGVLETVKKLQWAPDIIHCHGWISSLIPFYLKTIYKDNPVFTDSRVVYSLYNEPLTGSLSKNFDKKVHLEGIPEEDTCKLKKATYESMTRCALEYSDGIILGSEEISSGLKKYVNGLGKPILQHQANDQYIDRFCDFYDEIMVSESVYSD
jgi:starch synthase